MDEASVDASPPGDPPGRRVVTVPPSRRDAPGATLAPGRVVVSDCGYLPRPRDHVRLRPDAIDKTIILLCVRGHGWCELDGVRHVVGPAQLMVLPPGRPHAYGADPDDPWTVWWVHLVIEGVTDVFAQRPPVLDVPDVFRLSGLIAEIVDELERDLTDASLLVASGAAWHLVGYLAASPYLARKSVSPLDRARDYLREHVADRITVRELAARANLSPTHFAASFRERFGVPVIRYHTELRMTEARRLLDTTDLRIAEVGRRVGYPDPYYFSRQFTAIHRMTPRAYRRQGTG